MRIWSSVGSAGRGVEVAGDFARGFFGAAGFFGFAGAALARVFFFGSGAEALPFVEGAAVGSAALLSMLVFGFLATVDRIPRTAVAQADFATRRLRNAREFA
jgi:hypothetical protein